jgi:formylglycine-generating enzyme required for sulfatase activity
LGHFGWFSANSGKHVHPPKKLLPSLRGVFDLHGNLYEWSHDWYESYGAEAVTDPVVTRGGSGRVFRGGCWDSDAAGCRSAFRFTIVPSSRASGNGFRLAVNPSGVSPEAITDKQQGAEPAGGVAGS